MPRFSNHDTDEFWEITLDGNAFHTTFGTTGTPAETSRKTWPDAARARAEYDKVVAFKESRGFTLDGAPRKHRAPAKPRKPRGPVRNAQLERVIAKDTGDVDAFRVYGDWLTEQGDVRGELIALQTAGHDGSELIDDNREHFLGDLHEVSDELMHLTWRNGFVDAARFEKVSGGADAEDRNVGTLLRALLDHPSGAFVRSLSFGTVDGVEDGMVDYGSIPSSLDPAPFVEAITIGDWDEWEVSWSRLGDASGFWKLPRLAALSLRVGSMDLGTIASKSLRSLAIITGGLTQDNIASLVAAKLPALERMHVYFGSDQYGATGGVSDLAPLLANKNKSFAKLRHLGLMNAAFTDELCVALAKAPLVRQLATLDLSKGTMSRAGVMALVASRRAFAHLDELVVSENFLDGDDLALLKGVAKKIVSAEQRDADADDRYVALGE